MRSSTDVLHPEVEVVYRFLIWEYYSYCNNELRARLQVTPQGPYVRHEPTWFERVHDFLLRQEEAQSEDSEKKSRAISHRQRGGKSRKERNKLIHLTLI